MSQPLTLIGTLLNADTTGANGTLFLQINRFAVVKASAGGPLGISPNGVVNIPIVNGAIQGTHKVYGNDAIDGITWYNAVFVTSGGVVSFTNRWLISDNGSSQFDIGLAVDLDWVGSTGGTAGAPATSSTSTGLLTTTVTFTLGFLEAMDCCAGPNENGASSCVVVVPTPAANEIIVPWFFWFSTPATATPPSGDTNLYFLTDNFDFSVWGSTTFRASCLLPTTTARMYVASFNASGNDGALFDPITDAQGLALLFGSPLTTGAITGGDPSLVITLTVLYTIITV